MPWLAWKEHPVQRSFDALQFVHVRDLGIFWKGMQATYPALVPFEHVRAARLCRERQIVFQGEIDELPLLASRQAIELTVRQHLAGTLSVQKRVLDLALHWTRIPLSYSYHRTLQLQRIARGCRRQLVCTIWAILAS